jgi:hypothetical protein
MESIVFVATVLCGLLTLLFIVAGLVSQRRGKGMTFRSLLAFSLISLLTAAFTIWQLTNTLSSVSW